MRTVQIIHSTSLVMHFITGEKKGYQIFNRLNCWLICLYKLCFMQAPTLWFVYRLKTTTQSNNCSNIAHLFNQQLNFLCECRWLYTCICVDLYIQHIFFCYRKNYDLNDLSEFLFHSILFEISFHPLSVLKWLVMCEIMNISLKWERI